VKRLIQQFDALHRSFQRRSAVRRIDLLGVGDDPGDGAKPAGDPHRLAVGK